VDIRLGAKFDFQRRPNEGEISLKEKKTGFKKLGSTGETWSGKKS